MLRPGVLSNYTNHPVENLVHKTKTIKILLGGKTIHCKVCNPKRMCMNHLISNQPNSHDLTLRSKKF